MLHNQAHVPVLQKEILDSARLNPPRTIFDGTLGLGGHAESLLRAFPDLGYYIATDLESEHLEFARQRLGKWKTKLHLEVDNFSAFARIMSDLSPARPWFVLLDLGICSHHVDNPEKGFSYQSEGPLNMAFGISEQTAEVILNTYSEAELTRILKTYGEEPAARKIARAITQRRTHQPLRTTRDLRSVVEGAVHQKDINGALKRTFQAVRIEVNGELDHLDKAMLDAIEMMKTGDVMAVITYHSLEDRAVKQFFAQVSKPKTAPSVYSLHEEVEPAQAKLITKKPITPSREELEENPRARSAKLRIIQKN